jgi:uncharacterized damage-inducible protein DinB
VAKGRPLDVAQELLEAFRRSGVVNGYLFGAIPANLWTAPPPGRPKGRTIAAIAAHIEGVRRTFARMGGDRPGPPSLDRRVVTAAEAQRAMAHSTESLVRLFEAAFSAGRARVSGQPRRAVDMLTYLMQHDAHHRGQITSLARDLGHRFTGDDVTRIWGWKAIAATATPRRRR